MAAEAERSLAEYIAAVAEGKPTPGGGSVAAVVGALAAALGEMVANLTRSNGLAPATVRELDAARERLTTLRSELLRAAAEDEAAYAGYRRAAAMPRTTDQERAVRAAAMRDALIVATDVPLAIARSAAETAALLTTIATHGNRHLRTDAALGALLVSTALRGALLNVRGNAALLQDEPRTAAYFREADTLEVEGIAGAELAYSIATRAVNSGTAV